MTVTSASLLAGTVQRVSGMQEDVEFECANVEFGLPKVARRESPLTLAQFTKRERALLTRM